MKLNPKEWGNIWYTVEQAIFSPRDNTFIWRFWCHCRTLGEAQKELRKIGQAGGRIIFCELKEEILPGLRQG